MSIVIKQDDEPLEAAMKLIYGVCEPGGVRIFTPEQLYELAGYLEIYVQRSEDVGGVDSD